MLVAACAFMASRTVVDRLVSESRGDRARVHIARNPLRSVRRYSGSRVASGPSRGTRRGIVSTPPSVPGRVGALLRVPDGIFGDPFGSIREIAGSSHFGKGLAARPAARTGPRVSPKLAASVYASQGLSSV